MLRAQGIVSFKFTLHSFARNGQFMHDN